jgi:hypothetical protein
LLDCNTGLVQAGFRGTCKCNLYKKLLRSLQGGYVDEAENDGDVYTREEMLEFLWDFASCMQDWNEFAKEKDLPYVKEVDEIEEDPCWFDDIDD